MAKRIDFNFDNTLASRVGAEGLTANDLDYSSSKDVVNAFRARVDSGEIGFPNLPDDKRVIGAINEFAQSMRKDIDDVLLVGIGGSALGPYALDVAIRGPHPVQLDVSGKAAGKKIVTRPRLVVLDNVDPGLIDAALSSLNPKRTAVCVITKSGSTAESLAQLLIVREWMTKSLGKKARSRIIAVTDPQKGELLKIAQEEKYPLFFVPANIGGRFSVFSPVGLVPAALIGLDINALMKGARDANALCWKTNANDNPALQSAYVHYALDTKRQKKIEVVFAYSSYLWASAFWYRQLWAESLGKKVNRKGEVVHTGQTPVAALGVTDQHSQVQLYAEGPKDKMITFWGVDKYRKDVKIPKDLKQYDSTGYLGGKMMSSLFTAERRATEAALTEAGQPNCRWMLPQVDEYNIGAFFQMLEFQTAFCGELYGIDAFDQPGVELGKKLTYGLMGRKGYEDFAKMLK
ncbi:MAG TPA: glucose-6-phosphate isomerase [Terriglobales bacterium]|nr:glucose-6-phosphate isomerase [Terriglobales bacterium]